MRTKLTYILACLLATAVQNADAQQYLFARYTPRDGLVNNRARFFYQDTRGRLYISTFGGLSVYDGSRFTNYTTEEGLATSLVNDIVEMGEDSLWIIPNGSALHCLVRGVLRNIKTADNFYPVTNQLVHCSDGHWYSIADQGFFRYENNQFIRIRLLDSTGIAMDQSLIQAIEVNRQLIILKDPNLGIHPASLFIYDLDTRQFTSTNKDNDILFLSNSPDNELLAATRNGIRLIDARALKEGRVSFLPTPPRYQAASDLVVYSIYFDRSGDCWLVTENKVIRLGRSGDQQIFDAASGLPPGFNSSVLQDKEGNMWFANDRNGIVKLVNKQLRCYAQPIPSFTVHDLSVSPGGDSVWLYDGNRNDLLLQKDNTQQLFHGLTPLPPETRLFVGRNAWLASGKDLYLVHFLPHGKFRATNIYRGDTLLAVNGCFDHAGDLLLVADYLTILGAGKPIRQPLEYLADQVAVDKYDRIWTVTRAGKLFVFRLTAPGRGVGDTAAGLHQLAVYPRILGKASPRSITVDNAGGVWIGTRDNGLYCLHFDDSLRLVSLRHLTSENGLSENFVNYLQCDPDNTIWACTPTGLDRITSEGTRFKIDELTYNNDNYQSIFRIQAAGPDMHLVLAKGGFLRVGPNIPARNVYLPHLLFSQVLAGNDPIVDTTHLLTLPYDRNTIAFSIGVTSFINETATRYSFLLEGSINPNWSSPSKRSAIDLVSLPPGRYTLKVKAAFLTGIYPELTAAYPFVILPPWWQNGWFGASVLLVLAGLIILLIRFYIRRKLTTQRILLEKEQAVERERTRIATDMHDDLGAGLSRIKFLSETIGIRRQQQLPIEDEITNIRKYSHEMIDKMGEIVWALNERNDSLSDLLSYARSYAVEYLLQAGIDASVDAPDELPLCHVGGEYRRNVYLTIKEALHNIIKHARAEHVVIRMAVPSPHTLAISISDDGIGFCHPAIKPPGNGLRNMRQRIKDLGGTLTIEKNNEGSGTTVALSLPI
jgi:signal transduction histidine kinase/ligand-binding sensor domain-containing protein